MTNIKLEIKNELKQLAQDLRIQKRLFKSKQREGSDDYRDIRKTHKMVWEFRHRHIARCILRGTPYERIESKVGCGNEADMDLVERYKEEYLARFEEVSHEQV